MYDYREAILNDIMEALDGLQIDAADHSDDELQELLTDHFWAVDSVTGNASGSYTFNRWTARDYVLDNLDLLREMAEEFGEVDECGRRIMTDDFEWLDVSLRCYLLSGVIYDHIEEIRERLESATETATEATTAATTEATTEAA